MVVHNQRVVTLHFQFLMDRNTSFIAGLKAFESNSVSTRYGLPQKPNICDRRSALLSARENSPKILQGMRKKDLTSCLQELCKNKSTLHIIRGSVTYHEDILATGYTGLFEMIVGDLTTCHTQYTSGSSM